MKKQKGQALIEFALVFPFFLLLVFGIIYSGMLFYDYSTLSNVARSAARERAITKDSTDSTGNDINDIIIENYFKEGKFLYGQTTSLYSPGTPPMTIETADDDIVVTINMQLGDRSPLMDIILPDHYSIVYHMRKDYKETTNSNP